MLHACRYLLHDRDAKFCAAFGDILRSAGIEPLVLPPRSPNLNAHLERWNRSGAMESLGEGGMSFKNDLIWRGLPPTRAFQLRSPFSQRKKPSRQVERDSLPGARGPPRRVVW